MKPQSDEKCNHTKHKSPDKTNNQKPVEEQPILTLKASKTETWSIGLRFSNTILFIYLFIFGKLVANLYEFIRFRVYE